LKHYLSIEEAAEFLSLSKSHLYRLTSQNLIPFFKVGKRCLFSPEKLREWVERQAVAMEVG
jgi:excisionase family DNA binding protein